MKKILLGIAVLIVILILAGSLLKAPDGDDWPTELSEIFYGRNSQAQAMADVNSPSETAQPSSNDSQSSASDSAADGVKQISISGDNFKFEPSEIRVKKGDQVKITFNNTGGLHDFVIDELNVRTKQIGSGASDSVEFTADKIGTFEFYCSVGKHRQMGMKGNLIVE